MQGVIIDILIGAILFTPIGFYAGYLQHKKVLKKEEEENNKKDDNILTI